MGGVMVAKNLLKYCVVDQRSAVIPDAIMTIETIEIFCGGKNNRKGA